MRGRGRRVTLEVRSCCREVGKRHFVVSNRDEEKRGRVRRRRRRREKKVAKSNSNTKDR
jgi:hypothetical protein